MTLQIKALVCLATILGVFAGGYKTGSNHIQAKWDKAVVVAEREAEKDRFMRQEKIQMVETKRVAKQVKANAILQSNLAKVDQYAPNNSPPLPGSFRLFHDASAAGEEAPDPASVNAPTVSLAATSRTLAQNYAACLNDQQRLMDLQTIVRVITNETKDR